MSNILIFFITVKEKWEELYNFVCFNKILILKLFMNVFNDVVLSIPNVLISEHFSYLKTNISQIIE